MDFNVLLVLLVAVVFVATLVYIFIDQRNSRANPPTTITAPPVGERQSPSAPPSATNQTNTPPIAPARPASRPRPAPPTFAATERDEISAPSPQSSVLSPQSPSLNIPPSSLLTNEPPRLTESGRLRGATAPQRTRSQPIMPINDDPVNLADGLTAEARRDLDYLGGGIGGNLATDEDIAPPIVRRMSAAVPSSQPPIQPAMSARRARSATLAVTPDDVTDAYHDDLALAAPTLAAQTVTIPNSSLLTPHSSNARVFRNVVPNDDEDLDDPNYLPESRANLPNRLIMAEERDEGAPWVVIGLIVVVAVIVLAGGWVLLSNLFNSNKDKAPAAQFAVLVAQFGANDVRTSGDFAQEVGNALSGAGFDATSAGVTTYPRPISDEADAAARADHYNSDMVIWGDLPNANATALAPHYHLQVNNPPSITQRQGITGQMLDPSDFAVAPVLRSNMEQALVDFTVGLALYYTDRAADAKDKFDAAIAAGLDTPALHFYRAASLMQLGDYAGASGEYAKAGGVDDAALLNNRALAEQGQGNSQAALADYDSAIKLLGNDPRAAIPFRNRANIRVAAGRPDLAKADLALATAARPNYAPAWYDLCRLDFDVNADPAPISQSDANAALTACNNALANDQQYAVALTQRGAIWLISPSPNLDNSQRDLADARDLLNSIGTSLRTREAQFNEKSSRQVDVIRSREVTTNQQLGVARYWMGRAYIERGKIEAGQGKGLFDIFKSGNDGYNKAIAEFQAALTADPNSYDAHAWYGVVLQLNGDPNAAAAEFEQAKKIDPARPFAYEQLASLYDAGNQHDKAAAEYEGLLNINPDSLYTYILLAAEYNALGQGDKVTATYQRAVQQQPHSADEFRYKGFAYDALQDYANAASNYEQAIALNPHDARAYFKAAVDYQQLGQREQAVTAYQQAATNSEQPDIAWYRAGVLDQQLGKLTEAEKAWNNSFVANPHFMLAYYQLAKLTQTQASRLDDTIKFYQQTLRADPNTTKSENVDPNLVLYDAHLQLGNIYRAKAAATTDPQAQADDNKTAQAEYAAAVSVAGNINDVNKQFESGASLCAVYLKLNDTADAIALGDQMIKANPNSESGYSCKGQAYYLSDDLHQLTNAEQNLSKAVTLNPQDIDALVALGRTYEAEGKADLAEQTFRQAIAVAPKEAAPHVGLGDVLYSRQQWAAAQQEYTTAVQLDASNARGYTGLGQSLMSQNNLAEAEKDYRRAISLDASLADPHLYLGVLLNAENRADEAMSEFQMAVSLRPAWATAQFYLGKAYLAKGQTSQAIDALTKATQDDPSYTEAYYELGNAYRAAGQKDLAISAYKTAVGQNSTMAAAWLALGLSYEDSGNRSAAADAYTHASQTATDPDVKRQADTGLARVAQ